MHRLRKHNETVLPSYYAVQLEAGPSPIVNPSL